ncbi:MAG TPA: hypothetical protein V6D50_11045 [Chroococcales cyanobacterium]
MNEDSLKQRINLELETISCNQLNELGNQAVKLGLIAGHGYHKGQYEILRQGKVLLMSPDEAIEYLQQLIQSIQET